jgi:hypothetical protein
VAGVAAENSDSVGLSVELISISPFLAEFTQQAIIV